MNDAAMTMDGLSFIKRLEIAADAISVEEKFLSYHNRNINGDEDPIIINVEDISLMNGKLYLKLAVCAGTENEEYVNCFLAEAYTCIERGQLRIDQQNDLYALLTYYLGVIGEKMIWSIPDDDPLYQLTGNRALEHYGEALRLIESNPEFLSIFQFSYINTFYIILRILKNEE